MEPGALHPALHWSQLFLFISESHPNIRVCGLTKWLWPVSLFCDHTIEDVVFLCGHMMQSAHRWFLKSCAESILVGDGKPACDFPLQCGECSKSFREWVHQYVQMRENMGLLNIIYTSINYVFSNWRNHGGRFIVVKTIILHNYLNWRKLLDYVYCLAKYFSMCETRVWFGLRINFSITRDPKVQQLTFRPEGRNHLLYILVSNYKVLTLTPATLHSLQTGHLCLLKPASAQSIDPILSSRNQTLSIPQLHL